MAEGDPTSALQEVIEHCFSEPSHLRDALTHRSYVNERPDLAPRDNERMEFLGDAILDLAASILLFRRFPEAREGELSRRRADLVCERTLADIARQLELGPSLRLGKGEERSGGRDKPRLLASALEALIAAVYLDAGEAAALRVGQGLLAPHVEAEEPGARDFKSRLQERLQGEGHAAPTYELVATEGPDHDRLFRVEVRLEEQVIGAGEGRSKSGAEQTAAEHAFHALEQAAESGG